MKWLALALFVWPMSALAMNWEGHDDWMEDHPAAVTLEQTIETARPLPPTPCEERPAASANPYEQVPLTGDRCARESKPLTPSR